MQTYDNIQNKRQEVNKDKSTETPPTPPLRFESLKRNKTLNAYLYAQQLQRAPLKV